MSTPVDQRSQPAIQTDSTRVWTVLAHISPLLLGLNIAVIAGKAYGWIGLLLPLGPLVIAGCMRVTGNGVPRGLRSLLGFTIVAGVVMAFCLLTVQLGHRWALLAYAFPLALLAFTLMIINFVLINISRAIRAWKGEQFDYPWVFSPVARLVGLPPIWEE